MKTKQILTAIVAFFTLVLKIEAIEGLTISVESTNVVLRWPSVEGETYIVQARASLDTNDTWQTLTNFYPALTGTNLTTFVHTNGVCVPTGTVSGGGEILPSWNSSSSFSSFEEESSDPPLPPAPWDSSTWLNNNSSSLTSSSISSSFEETDSSSEGGEGNGVCFGFYRVVRNGIHIIGLTNGIVLSGKVQFQIEVGTPDDAQIVSGVNLLTSETPVVAADIATNSAGIFVLDWETAKMPNGTVPINALAAITDASFTNEPVSVTISNVVSFPNVPSCIFGSQMWIYAELAQPSASWQVKMYADQTNYIGAFSGSTTNGMISFVWNLTGGTNTFTNESFDAAVHLNGATNASGRKTFAKETAWSSTDYIVAWYNLDGNGNHNTAMNDAVADGVVEILAGSYTMCPGNVPGGQTAFHVGNLFDKTNLLSYFATPGYRNAYIYSHGNPNRISGKLAGTGADDFPTSITKAEIQAQTGNFATPTPTNSHPFRFVFLDGCDTAAGTLCEAFGILPYSQSTAHFATMGVRNRAFIGYKKTFNINPSQLSWRALTLATFYGEWLQGLPLSTCVSNAKARAIEGFDSSMVIYGSTNMTVNSQ